MQEVSLQARAVESEAENVQKEKLRMGSWGYEPSNSDYAHDLLGGVEKAGVAHVVKLFKPASRPLGVRRGRSPRKLDSYERYARVGVVQLMSEQYGWSVPLRIAKIALADLKHCAADENFMRDWREPERGRQQIAVMISALEQKITDTEMRWNELKKSARFRKYRRRGVGPVVYSPLFGATTRRGAELTKTQRRLAPPGKWKPIKKKVKRTPKSAVPRAVRKIPRRRRKRVVK